MIHATCPEFFARLLGGGEAKVGDSNSVATVETKDILGLQVAVINAQGMTVIHCVNKLEEDVLEELVIPKIPTLMQYLAEQVIV